MTDEELKKEKDNFVDLLNVFNSWLKATLRWTLKNWESTDQEINDLCSNHITCLYSKFVELGNKFIVYYLYHSIVISQNGIKSLSWMFQNIKLNENELSTFIKQFYSNFLVEKFIKYEDYHKKMFSMYFDKKGDDYSLSNIWFVKFKDIFSSKRNKFVHEIKTIDDQKSYIDDFIYICPIYLLCFYKYEC